MRNKWYCLCFFILLFSCSNNSEKKLPDQETGKSERPGPGKHRSVGSLSFKLDGVLYEADNDHAKAWTTSQTPLAMLMAKNSTGLSVSMQIMNINGKGFYKLDGDSKGTVNFTIGGKTYWTRSVMGDNYLDLTVTDTKNQATVILLTGTFEGVLEDKDGNKVKVTEGKFSTESL